MITIERTIGLEMWRASERGVTLDEHFVLDSDGSTTREKWSIGVIEIAISLHKEVRRRVALEQKWTRRIECRAEYVITLVPSEDPIVRITLNGHLLAEVRGCSGTRISGACKPSKAVCPQEAEDEALKLLREFADERARP